MWVAQTLQVKRSGTVNKNKGKEVCIMKFKVLLVLCLLFASQITGQDPCTVPSGKPTCVCQTENGNIDLTDLASYGGYPAYVYKQ